jgi:predicted enzyme related to lactoylglutathione lyase
MREDGKIDYIEWPAGDLPATKAFYTAAFGWSFVDYGPDRERNTQLAVAYCLSHPQWRLSVQTHKYLGLP